MRIDPTRTPLDPTSALAAIVLAIALGPVVAPAAGAPAPLPPEVEDAFQQKSDELERARQAPRSSPQPLSREAAEAFERAEQESATRRPRTRTPLSDDAKKAFDQATQEILDQELVPSDTSLHSAWSLRIDLEPDAVLASSFGAPFVTVQEFNRRVRPAYGKNLYEARYKALQRIIRTRITARLAREAGYEHHPRVEKRVAKATAAAADTAPNVDLDLYEISDAQAFAYFRDHLEAFRYPDHGTRALFALRGSERAATEFLRRARIEPASGTLWFTSKPIPGSRLPQPLREGLFHAKPGDVTDVVTTAAGYYVAQLVERNPFDHFRVSVVMAKSTAHAHKILQQIRDGASFESFLGDREMNPVPDTDLPASVRIQLQDMELGEVSKPVNTPLGIMLVKLLTRWSEAPIAKATVVRVDSAEQGAQILPRLRDGQRIEGIEEHAATEDDLPAKLRDVARTLKEGEYSEPVETDLGVFLIRPDKRERKKYQPFADVKDDVKRRLRAAKIAVADKRAYYDAHREDYRSEQPVRIVDIIVSGGEDDGLTLLDEVAGIADDAKRSAAFDSALKSRGFESVSIAFLPEACKIVASKLVPGKISQRISTDLGHFVLRFQKIVDPSYIAFEDVELDIWVLLADREAAALQELARLKERDREIDVEMAEERALALVYRQHFTTNPDAVSDREAEQWWQQNKVAFLEALGASVDDIPTDAADTDLLPTKIKKMNFLGKRLEQQVQDRYNTDGIVIYDHLLRW